MACVYFSITAANNKVDDDDDDDDGDGHDHSDNNIEQFIWIISFILCNSKRKLL